MVYAASNISYFYFPWEYFLKTQKKRGIKTLDIYGSMPHFWIDEYSYNDSKLLNESLKKYGMEAKLFTPKAYNYCIFSPDETYRKSSVSYYRNCIEFAKTAGIKNVCLLIPEAYADLQGKELTKGLKLSLIELSSFANEKGICLLIEPAGFRMLATIKQIKALIEEIKTYSIGISISMRRIKAYEKDNNFMQWFEHLGDYIKYVRIADYEEKHTLENSEYRGNRGVFITDDSLWDNPEKFDEPLLLE